MTPERFQQIEQLYHAVRERSADERERLLAGADPELRREIESLLAEPIGGEFLDQPAMEDTSGLLDHSDVMEWTAGARVGPYRIDGKLGEGGMGEVFRAFDTRLRRAVAIKVTQERFVARFEREARAIASLNHPHICTLHDVGPNYLVMELVEGETLAARVKSGPLPTDMALLYASQILAALTEAHSKGIIHRDLKPANTMIAKSGIKVLDFGLAKVEEDQTVTGSRMVMGTPAYMSPEQTEGRPADARSDIYSFGKVFYEMLMGGRATTPRARIPSPTLEKVVSRCLEQDPERRWQSAAELARELSGITTSGSRLKRTIAPVATLLGLLAAAYFYYHRAPGITDKDTLVLADFVNQTSDPIFDGTLRQGLAVQLEQSPFLKIMDDQEMHLVLRRMGLPPGSHIANQIAREICVREGAAATIEGTIASLGSSYVVTIQAVSCQDGASLGRSQIQAEDKEHVLKAVGTAGTAMRSKLGESLSSIERLNRPLEQATTTSLEALQNYSAGFSHLVQGQSLAAVPSFERAFTLDPNFAMAYQSAGVAFDVAGDIARRQEYFSKAFSMIDRVSEYERHSITGSYYSRATGEMDKAIDAYQLGIRDYPRSWGFHNNLSLIYIDLGRFDEGLKEGLEAVRLQASAEPSYRRQLDAYLCLDRSSEAKRLAERLKARKLGEARIHQRYLELAYLEEDRAAIAEEIQWFAGKPAEYISFGLQAAHRNLHGQRLESHKLYRRAAETARRWNLQNLASDYEAADARADALSGNCRSVGSPGHSALALAMCGDAARAEKLASETSKLFPNGTIWIAVLLPEIRAAIAINRDQPALGVELLESALPYEGSHLAAVYLRGLAYLSLRKGTEAITEFKKIVDHKGANWAADWEHPYQGQCYSLSYLGMARGFALAGDTAKARQAFQTFFDLWKDADPDLPALQQAKSDYARLR